jgi:hypothetical protein
MNHDYRPGQLEKFGIFYLHIFRKRISPVSDLPPDDVLKQRIRRYTFLGVMLSGVVGLICVFPMIWADVRYQHAPWYIHYGIVAAVTILLTLVEFYFLFLIALKLVHEIAETIYIHAHEKEYLFQGPFSIINILSRTALEIQEPEMEIFGINPFEKISKRNLLVLGLLYKLKIFMTNLVLKYTLLLLVGKQVFGISILYEALLVEFFWNAVVIFKVMREARLRLGGFVLANEMTRLLPSNPSFLKLSEQARQCCLRAIGNTVVLTRNYHPNMVVLLLEFKEIMQMQELKDLDNWPLFLSQMASLSADEKNFVLDVLTVAAAFDGRISDLEYAHLKEAYAEDAPIYLKRIQALREYLTAGKIHAALQCCNFDFQKG